VNKALIIAYKATNNCCTLGNKQNYTRNPLTHFSPFDIQDFVPEAKDRTKYVKFTFA